MKRLSDIILSLLAIILLSPVIIITMILSKIFLGGEIFFTQERPGFRGKPFHMMKFRSMSSECDANGKLLSDADRLTRYGKFLRSSSLDELPELWNILKGDMSVVGPRPLLMEYLPLYSPEQQRRHNVRPGLTGWAQVNGRNAISWDEKFKLDIWYVDNHSFWLDIKIIVMTVHKIFKRSDINAQGEATMSKFTGSQ